MLTSGNDSFAVPTPNEANQIFVGEGNDVVYGGNLAGSIFGGNGNDVMFGGNASSGYDEMQGGADSDSYVHSYNSDLGFSVIYDTSGTDTLTVNGVTSVANLFYAYYGADQSGLHIVAAAAAQFTRREILAPQAGTVLNLKFATVGGVISPSEPIMEIVPSEERSVIDGKVSPRDVDQRRLGLTAEVMFVGLNRRTTPMLRGRVIDISADILEDTQSGRPYFTVRIELPDSEIARLGEQKIQRGMLTQLVILTGDRTPMDYILSPLRESLMIAMREG